MTQRTDNRARAALALAATSLLTSLAIGVGLLLAFNAYFAGVESRALESAAQRAVRGLDRPNLETLDAAQIALDVAFVTRTRVQFYDRGGKVIADSGAPSSIRVASDQSGALEAPGQAGQRQARPSAGSLEVTLGGRAGSLVSEIVVSEAELPERGVLGWLVWAWLACALGATVLAGVAGSLGGRRRDTLEREEQAPA
jgi:hypothetical protein